MAINSPLYFAVTAAVFASTIASTKDYCNVKTCVYYGNLEDHTMCKYPDPGPAAACGQVKRRGVSDDEKNRIVNVHNQLRQKVASGQETCGNPGPQPAAVRMPNLTWDNELEKVAQRWADQCIWGHDQCRNVDRFQVGQNLAQSYSFGKVSHFTVEQLIQRWYDEVCLFDSNKVSSFEFHMATGHYTQMVWADTVKIGCGLISYTEINGGNKKILVCNYGPTGNWPGQRIYEVKN